MHPPPSIMDPERLATLAGHSILDTPPDPAFDGIVELATQICATPISLVSLISEDRQWFKAQVGFHVCETDLNRSVCAHTLSEPDMVVIPDLTQDARTRDNPLVTGPPFIRFYAGVPLRIGGANHAAALGALCVIDTEARPAGLEGYQAAALRTLGQQVMRLLDLHRAIAERDVFLAQQAETEMQRQAMLQLGDTLRAMTSIADMSRAATSIVGEVLQVSRAAFGRIVQEKPTDDISIVITPDWTAPGTASIAGRHRLNDYGMLSQELLLPEPLVIEDVLTDPRTAETIAAMQSVGVRALVNMQVRENGRAIALLIVHDDQPRHWTPEVLTFLRNVADRLEAGTARLRADAEQQVLSEELSHRLKNTFAMIQAIALQTLRRIPDQGPVEAFIRRLHALSSAHDVLVKQRWSAARMDEVVHAVLGTLVPLDRADMVGAPVVLGPRATLSVSLLLHELATNAIKYGALSNDRGRVSVRWHTDMVESDAPGTNLVLSWRETGGPPVVEPKTRGFGSKLIQMGLIGTGGVALRYSEVGFEADFEAPLAQVQMT